MPQVSHIEPGPDTFRILLTTDNHIGFKEDDKIRGDDGWKTFEEIMHLASEKDVDMVVQGGDLFHVNKPTKKSYYHVMRLLRECCWNDKPIEFKLISDPTDAMATRHFAYPSEYDPSINVGLPVYAISGNHDDATGDELLSPLDLLSVSGLMNHFGRVTNNDNIVIHPLLFNKGTTNLALYGLQSVREERLIKTMVQGNLEFLKPDTDESYQWFNLMCIHQNHVPRPGVKVVEETSLPDFLDFVLWGHEHECFTSTHFNHTTKTDILLPGSSIATSLSEGEVPDKHVFVLSVKGKDFSLEPIKLKSVRPFTMKEVILSETGLNAGTANKGDVLNFLLDEVDKLIEDARSLWKFNNKKRYDNGDYTDADIPLPLVRLRVDYTGGYEVENPRFFSNRFVGKVANVNDVVLFFRKKTEGSKLGLERKKRSSRKKSNGNEDDEEVNMDEEPEQNRDIVDMIDEGLNDSDLILLRKEGYTQIVDDLISKEDKVLLSNFVKEEEEKDLELLLQLNINDDADGDGNDATNKAAGTTITSIKKNFRYLARQIRAESVYSKSSRSISPVPSAASTTTTTPTTGIRRGGRKSKKSESVVADSDSDADLTALNYFASAQAKLAASSHTSARRGPKKAAATTNSPTRTRKAVSTTRRGGRKKIIDEGTPSDDDMVITSGSDQEIIELDDEDDDWGGSTAPAPIPTPKKKRAPAKAKRTTPKKKEVQSQLSEKLFSNLGRRR